MELSEPLLPNWVDSGFGRHHQHGRFFRLASRRNPEFICDIFFMPNGHEPGHYAHLKPLPKRDM